MNRLKEFFEIDVNNLREKQKELLKEAVIGRLNKIRSLIEKDKYSDVEKMLEYSPSGDEAGCNNHYIDFSDIGQAIGIKNYDYSGFDIGDMIEKLKELS